MSEHTLEIRPPGDADLDELITLLIAQLREHSNELPDHALARAAAGMMRRPQRGQFLIARHAGELVGFAALSYLWTLERGGRAGWLDELYVVPQRRGQGIGRELLAAALAAARTVGALAVDLEIEIGHERAASLYERAGFSALPRTRMAIELDRPSSTPSPVPDRLQGGCFCGAVRYRIDKPLLDVTHCHCSMCRRISGAPMVTWLTVPAEGFSYTSGTAAELRSSERARRTFCGTCGTALTFRLLAEPAFLDVTAGSLDAPEAVAPRAHIWTADQLAWLRFDDDLPRHHAGTPR